MAAVASLRYSEAEDAGSAAFFTGYRPWMSLLGVRLRPAAARAEERGELSLIEQLLPEELLLAVFARLPITSLAAAQCVCGQWRRVGGAPPLWRRACM